MAIFHVLHDSTCPTCHDSAYKPRPICNCDLVARADKLALAIDALIAAARVEAMEECEKAALRFHSQMTLRKIRALIRAEKEKKA